jgi:hypothetical protein
MSFATTGALFDTVFTPRPSFLCPELIYTIADFTIECEDRGCHLAPSRVLALANQAHFTIARL